MSAIGQLREERDPCIVWTHDEAQRLIRNAAPGASVTFHRTRDRDPDAAEYRITLERIGRTPIAKIDFYALPFRAPDVIKRVRTLADLAVRDAHYGPRR